MIVIGFNFYCVDVKVSMDLDSGVVDVVTNFVVVVVCKSDGFVLIFGSL